ncbi:MAG: class I SAM-dependent methyltransferase [Planctomycetaceae bacterium]
MTKYWHDDDTFWEAIGTFLFTDERCGDVARREVDQALNLLGTGPGASVLDLCCGVGRHAVELARRGLAVTGVDRTESYLNRARRQAAKEGLAVEFVQCGMESFRRETAFDGAINLFTSFGFFESDEEELRVLQNVFDSLKPGSRFLIDLVGKEVLARTFQPRTWQSNLQGTAYLLEERTIRSGWSHIDNRWIVASAGGCCEFRLTIRVYSGRELESLLRRAGFSDVTLYGSLAGAMYNHEAERLVAVAQK